MSEVIVVIGPGSIGQAIARRVSAGKHVVLADLRQANADAAAEVMRNAGFDVTTTTVDVVLPRIGPRARRDRHRARRHHRPHPRRGRLPSQAPARDDPRRRPLRHRGRARGVRQRHRRRRRRRRHRLPVRSPPRRPHPRQNAALATTPAEELLALPMLQPDQVTDTLHAYQLAKRGNALRVMAEAVRWAERGARINTISPGIIITPLAVDELTGPRGEGYRRMIELSPAGRAGTPDEVATLAALLMGPDGAFITGSDFLMDGGVTASYFYGELAPQ